MNASVSNPVGANTLRYWRLLLACMFILAFALSSARAQDSTLRTWLKFDDAAGTIATDSSGLANNGQLLNMDPIPTNWVSGKLAGALAFDGADDYVRVNNVIGDDFTIALWVNTTQSFPVSDLTYRGTGLVWSDVAGSANDFILGFTRSGTGVDRASFFTGNPDTSINGTSSVDQGTWLHLAATRQKLTGHIALYINGYLEAEGMGGTHTLTANPAIHIGGNTLDGRYFAGTIDDLRLYNRVLSPLEIAALAGVTLTNRPPVAGTNTLNAVTNTVTRIDTAWLLANASDPDNDPLSVAAVDPTSNAGGFVALTGSTVTYTPPPGFVGQDQFAYFISDGQGGTGTGVVLVTVSPFGWQPGDAPLLTRWATNLSPSNVLPEYPRPQMVRPQWLNLNGLWDYVVVPINLSQPAYWAGTILVPFPIESALSGVMRPLLPSQRLWYRRSFILPSEWSGQRVLLHFGAVDWEASVWVNGTLLGTHRGGYDPFTFDITDALAPTSGQEVTVAVSDPTDSGGQPRGKQVLNHSGIWYTPSSGIWQTVWIEPVPVQSISDLKLIPDLASGALRLSVAASGATNGLSVQAAALDAGQPVVTANGGVEATLTLSIPNVKPWLPDAPFLYDLRVTLLKDGLPIDEVTSYFGMRDISVANDSSGIPRLHLNGRPLFHLGTLDQGFWPDGLYTAPTDDALRFDPDTLKQLGFNAVRKHVKVEPDRWYYWCDKLGLLVWQDMPSGNNNDAASRQQFQLELQRMVRGLWNHPCIIMWVPFNEGWGQFDTAANVSLIQGLDPSRLVNNASGWTDTGVGDVHDIHQYPGPGAPPVEPTRAAVLGEFGGLGHIVSGHCWNEAASWGYSTYPDVNDLTAAYVGTLGQTRDLAWWNGLAAAIYTQTTDVEVEVNGLMTYDRAVLKMPLEPVATANRLARVSLPRPDFQVILPTSETEGALWLYTTNDPGAGWQNPSYNTTAWRNGLAGFGTAGTPGAVVRTTWNSSDIWLRRTFDAAGVSNATLLLRIHHDEDAEIYLNGVLASALTGYTTAYATFAVNDAARITLQPVNNLLAIHCHQTRGGQYIDAGLLAAKTYVALTGATLQTDGTLWLLLAGDTNAPYTLWATTNLALPFSSWLPLTNGVLTTSPATVPDPQAPLSSNKFYRLSLP